MAFTSYRRLSYAIGALVMATLCTTGPTYAHPDQTGPTITSDNTYIVVMAGIATPYDRGYDVPVLALVDRAEAPPSGGYPAYAPAAVKERFSRAAVRPTSVAGWRSGRVRRLAA